MQLTCQQSEFLDENEFQAAKKLQWKPTIAATSEAFRAAMDGYDVELEKRAELEVEVTTLSHATDKLLGAHIDWTVKYFFSRKCFWTKSSSSSDASWGLKVERWRSENELTSSVTDQQVPTFSQDLTSTFRGKTGKYSVSLKELSAPGTSLIASALTSSTQTPSGHRSLTTSALVLQKMGAGRYMLLPTGKYCSTTSGMERPAGW
jgi:hypothetical protein